MASSLALREDLGVLNLFAMVCCGVQDELRWSSAGVLGDGIGLGCKGAKREVEASRVLL